MAELLTLKLAFRGLSDNPDPDEEVELDAPDELEDEDEIDEDDDKADKDDVAPPDVAEEEETER